LTLRGRTFYESRRFVTRFSKFSLGMYVLLICFVVPTECDVLIVCRQHNDKEWKFKEQHAKMWENIAGGGAIRYSRPRGFNIAGASAPVAPAVPTPLLHSYACACVLRLIPMLIRAQHTPAIIRVSAWPHRHHAAAHRYNTIQYKICKAP